MTDTKEVKALKRKVTQQQKKLDLQDQLASVHKQQLEHQKKRTDELIDEHTKLKKVVQKHADVYLSEMKKALSTAILAAFAFLMALSWREYITEVFDTLLQYSPVRGKLVSALLVTLISVIGIVIVTRLLQVKDS